jgi:hypothetical protein
MPYYHRKNVLFIHIPKTGGTVIETNIKKYTPESLYSGPTNRLLEFPYNKTSLQHQLYTTIYKFRNILNVNFDNIKIFAVVRNPYDRIISDLFWFRLINIYSTADEVYNVIKNNYLDRDNLDNHNIPQYKFVVDESGELVKRIKIFNTETLNKSNNELNKLLGLNINIKRINVNKDYNKYLNKDSICLINSYYKKDFELFNYQMR